jgi:hypothetical protein
MSRKFLTPLRFLTRASDPSSGNEGDAYFNTSDSSIRVHNGSVWVTIMKSNDPVPFYMHTHNYNGEVDSVFPVPLTVEELGGDGFLLADGGLPASEPTPVPNVTEPGALDGGIVG